MKKVILIAFLLFAFCFVKAQSKANCINFNKAYTLTSDWEKEPCAGAQLEVKVIKKAAKLLCTITIDDKKISGYLVKNTIEKDNAGLYNFFRSGHPSAVYLFIKFYTDDSKSKADIINQDGLKVFVPCFDHKLMTLEAE